MNEFELIKPTLSNLIQDNPMNNDTIHKQN